MAGAITQANEKFGKYILLEKLATGGMAEVWLAKAPSAGGISKFVAVKRILPQFSENPEFIDMFKEEAKIAINLNHSNIVSIYEFGMEKKQFFLVMDYVEGRNLRQILNKLKKSKERLSTEQILYVIKEVAAGLDHAHRCLCGTTGRPLNITHRDISPQNVMISFEGEVKVVDFGIAKAESQLETTRAGTLKGKFGYMSPEQTEGLSVDLRTDIFSLGIVLWELLANERLFVANNEINTLRKIRDCQIPSLRKLNPSIPIELERIVSKALTRDRSLRYQTAAAFHKDLNRFLNRQYPDFSPQDFSLFVRTQFSNEILETRKRTIEYAKATTGDDYEDFSDKTEVTATMGGTHAMGVDAPGLPVEAPVAPKNFSKSENASSVSFDELKVNKRELLRQSLDPEVTSPGLSTGVSAGTATQIPHLTQTAAKTTSSQTLTYETFSPPPMATKKKSSAWVAVVALLLVAGGFMLSGQNLLPAGIQKQVQSLVSSILGSQEKSDDNFNFAENHDDLETLPEDDPADLAGERRLDEETQTLTVYSVPSGAQIFVDHENTGVVTPGIIQVPKSRRFQIELRSNGYSPFVKSYLAPKDRARLNITLKAATIGYLNIDVVPNTANVIIDGIEVRKRPPIRNYAVEANKPVLVKALDPVTGAVAQTEIVVEKDKVRKIVLYPQQNNLQNRRPSAQNR